MLLLQPGSNSHDRMQTAKGEGSHCMMWPLQVLPEGLRGKAFVAAPLKSPVGQREGVGGPAKDPPQEVLMLKNIGKSISVPRTTRPVIAWLCGREQYSCIIFLEILGGFRVRHGFLAVQVACSAELWNHPSSSQPVLKSSLLAAGQAPGKSDAACLCQSAHAMKQHM